MARGRIHTINLAVYPQVLTVLPGDTVRVITEFDYAGPELKDARMISAIWHPTLFDPHNEIVRGNKTFTIPSSPPPGNHITVTMDLLVPSGEVGTDYGLYSSLRDVPGPDIYHDPKYYENIITIEEVVPEFKGTISKKELEYDESQVDIPAFYIPGDVNGDGVINALDITLVERIVAGIDPPTPSADVNQDGVINALDITLVERIVAGIDPIPEPAGIAIPEGQRGLVHIWGRNDMAISQKLGIHWIVKDPDGIVVEDYQDWEFGTTGPGDDHHFIGGRFDLNKSGTWTIGISLAMNPESPVQVASYAGVLCTVGVPPAQYTLEVTVEPPATGYVTKSPSKTKYSAGEVVTLTAYPYSGYEFDHWGGWPPYPGVGATSPSIQITMDADWWVVAAFRKAAPVTTVSISLKNPPSDAENWTILLTDWDITVPIREISGKDRLGITEAAVFEIPSGVKSPLRVAMLQLTKWKIVGEVLQQVYYAQAMHPNEYDWDAGTFTGPPDPTYKELFIPEYGNYRYNVATERFEKV